MSGQATGWVLRNGPRDRAMRAVLIVIADAANADGEHAHPGMANVVEQSLYSAGHVQRITTKLVAEGWLAIEAEHAPGRATVYRIPGVRNTAHPEARSTPRTVRGVKPATPRIEGLDTALLEVDTAHSYARPYGLSNGNKQRKEGAAKPHRAREEIAAKPTTYLDARAVVIADEVWKRADPKPALGYPQVRSVALKLAAVRADDAAIIDAMLAAPTITVAAVEIQLNGKGARRNGSRNATAEDWAATERAVLAREATTTKGKR